MYVRRSLLARLGLEYSLADTRQLIKVIDVDGQELIDMSECVSYVTRVSKT